MRLHLILQLASSDTRKITADPDPGSAVTLPWPKTEGILDFPRNTQHGSRLTHYHLTTSCYACQGRREVTYWDTVLPEDRTNSVIMNVELSL
jgi:hypothetical protein